MTPATANPNPAQILATEEARVPELSQFLIDGFQLPASGRSALMPASLRWRYFEPRGTGPRSLVVREGNRFTAHIGVIPTSFVQPGNPTFNIPAVHPVDWLSTKQGGMLGTLLMLKAFGRADVQYSLGSTASGERILLGCGFTKVCAAPVYYHFFRPAKAAVWNFIHGPQGFPRNIAMFGLDWSRSVTGRWLAPRSANIQLRSVAAFTTEVESIFHSRPQNIIYSSRSAALLNYLLQHPDKRFHGWMIEMDGRNIGFALTHIVERDGLLQGKIADCFLASDEPAVWNQTVRLLTTHLRDSGCDLARTVGNAPHLQRALRASGFFPRGKATFFLRDTRNLLPKDRPFHLSLIEGDMSY
ncbi:MAG: hypothetical protein RLY20_1593 [Verrucomicrobiota bacterium]|jgi:hypothetical protein